MKNLFFGGFLLLFSLECAAQSFFELNNCTGITSYVATKGDTLRVDCDSVYVLNSKTFLLYKTSYEKLKNRDLNLKQMFISYENLIQLQEDRIHQQAKEYNQLKSGFDSIAATSQLFIKQTGENIADVSDKLTAVNSNLNEAILKIEESKSIVGEERKKVVKTRFFWGAGGFGLGIIICLLLK